MKKIIVLPMYGIGDVIMTTPALRNLKEKYEAHITYLHFFNTTQEILIHNPHIDKHIYFPFLNESRLRGVRFLMDLRNNYDLSINFYPSNRKDYNLASFLVGCNTRIGHRYVLRDLRELNFLKNKTVEEDDSLHNVQENLRLLRFLGIKETTPYSMKIYLTQEENSFAHYWLHERGIEKKLLIGLHPGTSSFKNHDKKRWPEVSFSRLIDMLSVEVKNSVFLLFGGPEEQPLRDMISATISTHRKSILSVNPVSIREAASLMAKCSLFISNDSGPMHMAAAVGVPTVAIFGPTNPAWVKPWGVKHRIVRSGLPCSPCFRYSPKPLECIKKIDFACLKEISPDDTFLACQELIKEIGQEQ